LYAIWVAQANNNLIYDGNAATTGSTVTQTASTSTMVMSNGFELAGSTFRNWNTMADGSGVAYQSNYFYSFAAGRTLYAQWGLNYAVTYDANTADSGTVPSAQSSFVGSPGVNLSLNTGNLRKAGYRLAGWAANPDGTGTPYALGASSVAFSGDKTIYAQWTPAIYSVIYAPNGAASGVEPASGTFTNGQTITLASNSGALEKPGYTFDGWVTDPNASVSAFQPAATETLSQDTVFFAFWRATAPVPSAGSGSSGGSSSSNPDTQATPTPTPTPSGSPSATPIAEPKQLALTVYFNGDSAKLLPVAIANLKRIAALAKLNGTASTITIIGRVKETADKSYDIRLSKQRATSVSNFLKTLGVRGTYKTVAAGISPENKAISRRVEVTLKWVAN
jgi:uncharacterized repeat protein (TIGR02543 family)